MTQISTYIPSEMDERGTKDVDSIQIPDMWHIAMNEKNPQVKNAILDVWHIAHDLKKHIQSNS